MVECAGLEIRYPFTGIVSSNLTPSALRMKKTIQLLGQPVEYDVRLSSRAKHVRLSVHRGGEIVMTLPKRVPLAEAERFLMTKERYAERAKKTTGK